MITISSNTPTKPLYVENSDGLMMTVKFSAFVAFLFELISNFLKVLFESDILVKAVKSSKFVW